MRNGHSNPRLSKLRQSLLELKDDLERLLPVFLKDFPLIKGSVYPLRRKCGKRTCRCWRGQLHETVVLSASIGGRTQLKTVPKDEISRVRLLTKSYQCFRTARAQLVKLYVEMVSAVDRIEDLRREEL